MNCSLCTRTMYDPSPLFFALSSIGLGWLYVQVNIIRMPKQLLFFEQYQERLAALIGADAAQQRVNQALVLITLGGNDFVNNYYLVPFSARSRQYSLPDYVRFLISEYRKILMVLLDILATISSQFSALLSPFITWKNTGLVLKKSKRHTQGRVWPTNLSGYI